MSDYGYNSSADQDRASIITAVIVIVVVGHVIAGIVLVIRCIRSRSHPKHPNILRAEEPPEIEYPTLTLRYWFYELEKATNRFHKLIGTGGFGSVYKGVLRDGSTVAVKKLNSTHGEDHQDFRNEVLTLGSAHHHNLVRLRGFCAEGPHRLLVYDYMSGGSLDSWLFAQKGEVRRKYNRFLSWKARMNIAVGSAKGLAYLHEECAQRIIHLDIKPQNILLDQELEPKVADFGLAKLLDRRESRVMTRMQGTIGYLAPEWLVECSATPKMDVYSFGMVLLEIISGRRNIDHAFAGTDRFYFPTWAVLQVDKGKDVELVDASLQGEFDEVQAKLMLQIAFWCIQLDPNTRPSMSTVVQMMEERVPVPRAPSVQAFSALSARVLSLETSLCSSQQPVHEGEPANEKSV